jgi:oligoribonuclease
MQRATITTEWATKRPIDERHYRQTKIMSQDEKSPSAVPAVSKDDDRLIWLDMEMTGLDPDNDRVIEVAVVVTDAALNVVAEAPVFVVHQSDAVLGGMDSWNTGTHARSGLTERVKASTMSEADVETALIDFLKQYVGRGKSPMCGNSICQDRRFMARTMPKLEAFFHYRNLDVSTLKELCKRWKPEVAASFKKHQKHEALADIHESIEELKHYREHFLKL